MNRKAGVPGTIILQDDYNVLSFDSSTESGCKMVSVASGNLGVSGVSSRPCPGHLGQVGQDQQVKPQPDSYGHSVQHVSSGKWLDRATGSTAWGLAC